VKRILISIWLKPPDLGECIRGSQVVEEHFDPVVDIAPTVDKVSRVVTPKEEDVQRTRKPTDFADQRHKSIAVAGVLLGDDLQPRLSARMAHYLFDVWSRFADQVTRGTVSKQAICCQPAQDRMLPPQFGQLPMKYLSDLCFSRGRGFLAVSACSGRDISVGIPWTSFLIRRLRDRMRLPRQARSSRWLACPSPVPRVVAISRDGRQENLQNRRCARSQE
jgi:hypothetical protein